MEDIVNLIINNGLGVASFFALLYFINTTMKETNATLIIMKDTLVTIQTSLINLGERVSDIENKIKE